MVQYLWTVGQEQKEGILLDLLHPSHATQDIQYPDQVQDLARNLEVGMAKKQNVIKVRTE